MMFGFNYTGFENEAKRIAKEATDDPVMQKYLEGLTHRVLVLEQQAKEAKSNFWLLLFILFGIPILNGLLFGGNNG